MHIGAHSSNLTDAAFNQLRPLGTQPGNSSASGVTLPFMYVSSLIGVQFVYAATVIAKVQLVVFVSSYFRRQLSLFGCRYLTDVGAAAVANCMTGLTYLNLEACHGVTNASIGLIAKKCVKLESFILSGLNIDDTAIVELAQLRKDTLRNLDISECTKLTDVAVDAVAKHVAGACAHLRSPLVLCSHC